MSCGIEKETSGFGSLIYRWAGFTAVTAVAGGARTRPRSWSGGADVSTLAHVDRESRLFRRRARPTSSDVGSTCHNERKTSLAIATDLS